MVTKAETDDAVMHPESGSFLRDDWGWDLDLPQQGFAQLSTYCLPQYLNTLTRNTEALTSHSITRERRAHA